MAGSSWHVNDRFTANALPEALGALIQGCQPKAVAFAAKALGRCAWNGTLTPPVFAGTMLTVPPP